MRKILFFLIGFALLAWMVWQAGPLQLWQQLLAWNWLLLATFAVWGVGYLLNAASFHHIICCYPHTAPLGGFSRVLMLTVGGYALNYITPFGLLGGEPWRIHQLRKVMDPQSANSAVAYYAMMHVLSHILFWIIAVVLGIDYLQDYLHHLLWALLIIVLLVGLGLSLAVRKGWISSLSLLLQQHPREFWTSLGLELLSRAVNVVEVWLLLSAASHTQALSVSLPSDYVSAYLVVAFSSLVANVLFFSPMQMGTREGGILLSLQLLLPMSASASPLLPLAVGISVATRIREFFWILVGLLIITISRRSSRTL